MMWQGRVGQLNPAIALSLTGVEAAVQGYKEEFGDHGGKLGLIVAPDERFKAEEILAPYTDWVVAHSLLHGEHYNSHRWIAVFPKAIVLSNP